LSFKKVLIVALRSLLLLLLLLHNVALHGEGQFYLMLENAPARPGLQRLRTGVQFVGDALSYARGFLLVPFVSSFLLSVVTVFDALKGCQVEAGLAASALGRESAAAQTHK
jgi:hypothetical protein